MAEFRGYCTWHRNSHVDEFLNDLLGKIGIRDFDGDVGLDSKDSQQAIKDGAGC
jgi:hypothetical protein